jgi:hypothetical protein
LRILDEKTEDYESEYRIYENGTLQTMFTTKYFDAVYFKSFDEAEEDLKNALTRVNKDGKEGNEMQNISRFNVLCKLLRKYHQGLSWFFSEKEYRENWYEKDDKDDSVIITQLDKLYSEFNMEKHFNQVGNKNPTESYLALTDPKNRFMITRFTITTFIAPEGYCSLCRDYIRKIEEGEVELPRNHIFHHDCLFKHMIEIQQCPVCHIFIHLDKNGRILNPYSDNYPEADPSFIRYIQNPDVRMLAQAPQRTE